MNSTLHLLSSATIVYFYCFIIWSNYKHCILYKVLESAAYMLHIYKSQSVCIQGLYYRHWYANACVGIYDDIVSIYTVSLLTIPQTQSSCWILAPDLMSFSVVIGRYGRTRPNTGNCSRVPISSCDLQPRPSRPSQISPALAHLFIPHRSHSNTKVKTSCDFRVQVQLGLLQTSGANAT